MANVDGLNEDFRRRLEQMVAASGGRITITSGYRSVEEQTRLWNQAKAKYGSDEAARKWVAPPGNSNHNHGIAADLGGDLNLAHELAPRYGLHFPMSWEPWHIEPLGSRDGKHNADAYTTPPDGATPVQEQDRSSTDYQLSAMTSALFGSTQEQGGADAVLSMVGANTTDHGAAATTTGTTGDWRSDVLARLGAPATPENLRALDAWHRAEGGDAAQRNNWLNTSHGMPGSTSINDHNVKRYVSYDQGVDATVKTLQNGMYEPVLAALRAGNNALAVGQAVKDSPWGTKDGVLKVLGGK